MSQEPENRPDPEPENQAGESLLEKVGHQVEGAVEQAEHQIERVEEKVEHALDPVVEQLPKAARRPVRWAVAKLVLLAFSIVIGVVLLGVMAVGYYLWNHTEYASHELTGRLNRLLQERSDVELSLDGLRGNPLRTVTVLHPRIRYRQSNEPAVLEASTMRLSYSTWDLLWGRRGAIVIEMEHPVVRLGRRADGSLRIPAWHEKSGPLIPKPASRGFDFELHLRNGEVDAPGAELDTRGLNVDLRFATDPTYLDVRSVSWLQGPHGSRLQKLAGTVAVDDSVVIAVRELRSSDLTMHGTAAWERRGGVKQIQLDVDRLRWAWLGQVIHNKTLNVPGEGRMTVQAEGGPVWRGRAQVAGLWDGLAVDASTDFRWRNKRLFLEDLRGTTKAGNLTGRLQHDSDGWWIEANAVNADPALWSFIGIRDWPAGQLDGWFRYAVDTRRAKRAHLDARLTDVEWAGWRADSGVVAVDFPPSPPVRFTVRALRRGGTLDLVGATTPIGWQGTYDARDFPLEEWPDGRATGLTGILSEGKGTVRGHSGTLEIDGNWTGRSTDWLGARTRQWTLTGVTGRLLPTPELDARVQLEDLIWLNTHFDHATAPFHLGDRRLTFTDFDAFAGDTLMRVDGVATWQDKGWDFNATRAELRSSRFNWVADAPMVLSGDPTGVNFERLIARDGPARLAMSGRWGLPGGRWDWNADVDQLDLARIGLPIDWKLGGTAQATLAIEGPVGQARWTLDGRALQPAGAGKTIDSALVRLSGGPSRLEIERARIGLAGGTIDARGVITDMKQPWADSLLAPAVSRWVAGARRWDGTVSADGVRLDALSALIPGLDRWRGTVGGTLKVAGRPGAPELDVTGDVKPLGWGDLAADSLGFEASFANEDLNLRQIAIRRGAENWRASGHLPLSLVYGEVPSLPERPMDVEVSLPRADLAVVPMLLPQIGYASGTMDLVARATGTPKKPDLLGTVRVRDGRVRLAGRDELLEQVNASLHFTRDSLVLDALTAVQAGRQRVPGTVRGNGGASLRDLKLGDYRFVLAMRNFTAVDPLYIATFDGDFIVSNGPKINGQVVPFVWSDDVRVQRAVVFYDFTKPDEGAVVEASTRPLQWVYDLHVRAKDNLRWTPSDADIEFDADLNVRQSPDTLLMFGDLHALRGWYDFLSTRFTVTQANLTFDDVGGLDPLVDVIATTRFTAVPSSGTSEVPQRYTVTVTIQGRSKEPTIEFTSDPATLDEAAILRQITIGSGAGAAGVAAGIGGSLDSYLTRQLNRQLSGELQRVFRGYLNELEINREGGLFSGEGDVVMTVGGQIAPNLGLRYQQRITSGTHTELSPVAQSDLFDRNIEAEYRLNRFISLTSGLVQRRATGSTASASPTSEYNVGLRARWEY
jgi:hypothetical protein